MLRACDGLVWIRFVQVSGSSIFSIEDLANEIGVTDGTVEHFTFGEYRSLRVVVAWSMKKNMLVAEVRRA